MIRVTGRELLALGRQAWLLRHDMGRQSLPNRLEAQQDVVVCMHGLFATAGVLRPLRNAVERHAATASRSALLPCLKPSRRRSAASTK